MSHPRFISNVSPGSAGSFKNGTSVPDAIVLLHTYPRSWVLLSKPCILTFCFFPAPRRSPPSVTVCPICFVFLIVINVPPVGGVESNVSYFEVYLEGFFSTNTPQP